MASTEPAVTGCYRHPGRTAGAACRSCGRPLCPECMRETPDGWQCEACSRGRSDARSVNQQWGQPPTPPGPPPSASPPPRRPAGPPATLGGTRLSPVVIALIAVNVLIYAATAHNQTSVDFHYGLIPSLIAQGQWYRLLTAAFLHVSVSHLLFNMITLAIVGPAVELNVGKVRFVALYLLAAAGGSVCSYLLSPLVSNGIGASGAIFGVMGAYFVIARRNRTETTTVLALIGINLLLSFIQLGIDWRAHVGGLLTGAAVALGYMVGDAVGGRRRWVASAVVVGVLAAALAGLGQLPPGHVNL